MKIKYKTSTYNTIKKVEIEKETASTVWIDGRAFRKITDYECYFDTFDNAKNYLIALAQEKIDKAKRQMEYAKEEMNNALNVQYQEN